MKIVIIENSGSEKTWLATRLAALSRSAFFERLSRAVGLPLAKDLPGRSGVALADVAERVGDSSAGTFSTAFSRHVGRAPGAVCAAVACLSRFKAG
jgi:AraC-like DNA-binding protein